MQEPLSPKHKSDSVDQDLTEGQDLLLQAALMLHRYGTPSHRLERVMKRISHSMGIEADFLYTPTALLVSFPKSNHRTELRRISPSGVDLGKLVEFDMALEDWEHGRASIKQTTRV
ncbi:MAG: threonine/serine exporter family protein [Pirellulaceae bacterium]